MKTCELCEKDYITDMCNECNQNRLEHIKNAMEQKPRAQLTSDTFYCITDNCNPELKTVLMDLIYDENIGGNNNLSYEICAKACDIIGEIDISEDFDVYEHIQEVASIWTQTRLEYLNAMNQAEVSDIVKEHSCDIQQACAVWYENMVAQACETLKDYVLSK